MKVTPHCCSVDFGTWWRAVTSHPREDSRTIPRPGWNIGRTVHVSTHTSFGIGSSPPSVHF